MSAEDDADFLKRFSVALERKRRHERVLPGLRAYPQLAHEPAIASVCGNCGLARFHIRSVLLDERDKPSISPTPDEQHSSAGP